MHFYLFIYFTFCKNFEGNSNFGKFEGSNCPPLIGSASTPDVAGEHRPPHGGGVMRIEVRVLEEIKSN